MYLQHYRGISILGSIQCKILGTKEHHHQKGQCLTYLYAKIIYNKKNQAVQFTALPVSHVTDTAPQ